MHDVVQDVALWIGKKRGQEVLVDNHAVSNTLVNKHQSFKDVKALSFWGLAQNFKLSSQLCSPALEILLLQPHGAVEDLEVIKALKLLALIDDSFKWKLLISPSRIGRPTLHPQSIVSLTNLHTLCIKGKEMGDVSFLGELKRLEILDLRGSRFLELPIGIVDLKKLRLLDICGCEIDKSSLEVIEGRQQLEGLYLWDNKSVISKNFSLSRLRRYVIHDFRCRCFKEFDIKGRNMTSLILSIMKVFMPDKRIPFVEYFNGSIEALTFFGLRDLNVSDLASSLKHLILQADYLWLANCKWDHKDINFEIKRLGVSYCKERRTIIDDNILQRQQVFSHLINLRLIQMKNLEQVFQNSSVTCSLPMLQELHIASCDKLIAVFSHATITSPPKLKELKIANCDKVKCLFSYSQVSHCPSLKDIRTAKFSGLERLINEEASYRNLSSHHERLGN